MPGLERLIGEVLDGKYRLEKLLGQGGMGAVYLATHLGTDRAVALKLIAPQFMRNAEFVERFKREARAAGRLRHPNVVDVTDFGFAESHGERVAYLVMEYLDGCTLADVLAEERRLPLDWVVEILEQVSSAVEEAHRQGIVHRDLKPDNIWLEPTRLGGYRVKVLDFGIAKVGEAGFDEETEPPRPAVDPLPSATPSRPAAPSSLEALQASIARAVAPPSNSESAEPMQPEAATQIFAGGRDDDNGAGRAPVPARGVEAATQLYAPAATSPDHATAREDEQGTQIFAAPAAPNEQARATELKTAGAARQTVNEPAAPDADDHARARQTAQALAGARATHLSNDADRTRMLDAVSAAPAHATPRQSVGPTHAESGAALTRVGSIMGTPLYMSPEQCRGERLDARSDIYSLGVIAYQMLAGETPFAGDVAAVMRQHVAEAPAPLRRANGKKIRKRVERVVLSALAKEPAARPQSAAAFASSLRANSAGTGTLLRRAFALYSEHFPLFLRLTVVAHAPVFVTTALLFSLEVADARGAFPRLAGTIAVLLATLLHTVASFISNSVISGVTAVIVTQLQLAPLRPVSLRSAFAVLRRRWRPFLRTSVGVTLRMFLGFALFLIPGLWMMVKYMLYAPVVLIEGLSKKAARMRSNELSRRSRGSVVALIVINMAVPLVIGAVVGGMSVRAGRGGDGVNVSSASDPGGVNVSTSTGRSGISITTTGDDAAEGDASKAGASGTSGDAPATGYGASAPKSGEAGGKQRARRQVDISAKAVSHLISLLNIVVVPLISITVALLYLKLRQMGGETLSDTLAQFEEIEPPRTRWQRRMREGLSARSTHGQRRTTDGTGDAPHGPTT